MSYFRGDLYIWRDGSDDVHIWSEVRDPGNDTTTPLRTKQMIKLSKEEFAQLAVMHFAELIEEGRLDSAIHNACKVENGGSYAIRSLGKEIVNRLRTLKPKPVKVG